MSTLMIRALTHSLTCSVITIRYCTVLVVLVVCRAGKNKIKTDIYITIPADACLVPCFSSYLKNPMNSLIPDLLLRHGRPCLRPSRSFQTCVVLPQLHLTCAHPLLGRHPRQLACSPIPTQQCRGGKRHFSSRNHLLKQTDAQAPAKRKPARSQSPTSLRRVAAEAQFTRDGFIKRSGKRRFVDPEAHTKQVIALCAAEQYNIPAARRLLRQEGYDVDPFNTGLYPQVIHIQTPNFVVKDPETGQDRPEGVGDVFVFPSGSIVTWNVPETQQQNLVNRILKPAAENPHLDTIEIEDLEYLEDSSNDTSRIIGDTILLGTKATASSSPEDLTKLDAPASTYISSTEEYQWSQQQSPEASAVLAKIAFSSGLARSTKLAVLENLLSSYFSSTRSIPTILSRGSKLRFTRSFILRKTGELLSIRAQLNLYSELTDSLPDLFWDSPSSLGLSDYYDEVGRALDVNSRIRVLNEKIDYASEIASVLRERLSEKHSTDLEWLIIFLISIEVVFELWRIWRERNEMKDPESTEALLKDYLLRQRQRDV